MKIIVSLNQFEIFISELDDLVNTENFSQVRKRNIILPFSLLMLRESYGILDTSRSKIVTYNRTKVDLDKLALRVSYNDVKLLYSSLAYQLEQLSANSTETATDVKDKIGQEVTKALELPAPTEEVQSSTVFNKSKGGVVFEESKTTTDEDVNADFDEFIISNQGIQLVINSFYKQYKLFTSLLSTILTMYLFPYLKLLLQSSVSESSSWLTKWR